MKITLDIIIIIIVLFIILKMMFKMNGFCHQRKKLYFMEQF